MKSTVFESFVLGVAFGIGLTALALYTRKPGCFAVSLESLAEMGRTRRVIDGEIELRRQRLKAMGFSDGEVAEIYL